MKGIRHRDVYTEDEINELQWLVGMRRGCIYRQGNET